jgi:GNAT superfamily N-acetyltransferase
VFANCEVWGAQEGSLIGFIAFREGWIDQLYVLPQKQRRGAGRALLQVAMTTYPNLMLWTFQKNAPSRRFYEANGFLVIQETDGGGNQEREPDVLYRWDRVRA